MFTGLSLVEAQFEEAYLERKSKAPDVEALFINGNLCLEELAAEILPEGFNKFHKAGIVYRSPIAGHWFYSLVDKVLMVTDIGEAVFGEDEKVEDLVNCITFLRWLCSIRPEEASKLEEAIKLFGRTYAFPKDFQNAIEIDGEYAPLR